MCSSSIAEAAAVAVAAANDAALRICSSDGAWNRASWLMSCATMATDEGEPEFDEEAEPKLDREDEAATGKRPNGDDKGEE